MYMSVSGIDLYTGIQIDTANGHIPDRSLPGVVYKSIPLTDIYMTAHLLEWYTNRYC
jgi:hypothetical protein